jgi:hypothetical protein
MLCKICTSCTMRWWRYSGTLQQCEVSTGNGRRSAWVAVPALDKACGYHSNRRNPLLSYITRAQLSSSEGHADAGHITVAW